MADDVTAVGPTTGGGGDQPPYVETDQRRRASLGRSATGYLMHEEPDGTIILEPASVISDLERRFLADAALQARIDYPRSHPEQSVQRKPRRTR